MEDAVHDFPFSNIFMVRGGKERAIEFSSPGSGMMTAPARPGQGMNHGFRGVHG